MKRPRPIRDLNITKSEEQAMSHVASVEQLYSLARAAAILGTTERFPRRLVAERRIRFVRVGRHVRIPESALVDFVQAGTVEPMSVRWRDGGVA